MDRIIVASNSISNVIKFQSRICHFVQKGKEKSPGNDRKKKRTIMAIPPGTASIYNQPFQSRRGGEDGMLDHMSALPPFIPERRIQ